MKRFLSVFLTLALLAGLLAVPALAADTALDTAYKNAASFAVSQIAHPTYGDDWAVLGTVRGGAETPERWTDSYVRAIAEKLLAQDGVLSQTRLTEYARVILGLTSLGVDPTNVAGYDLLQPLSDYDAATNPA